jgi:hypothetical protein
MLRLLLPAPCGAAQICHSAPQAPGSRPGWPLLVLLLMCGGCTDGCGGPRCCSSCLVACGLNELSGVSQGHPCQRSFLCTARARACARAQAGNAPLPRPHRHCSDTPRSQETGTRRPGSRSPPSWPCTPFEKSKSRPTVINDLSTPQNKLTKRHSPKTSASIPKSLAQKMQGGSTAAGMEATFSLQVSKFDSANM